MSSWCCCCCLRGSAVIAASCGSEQNIASCPSHPPLRWCFSGDKLVQDVVCGFSCVHQLDWSDGTGAQRRASVIFVAPSMWAVSRVGLFLSPPFFFFFFVSVDVHWVVANFVDSGCCDAYHGGEKLVRLLKPGFLVFGERCARLFCLKAKKCALSA